MKNNLNKSIKAITEGGIFVAAYALLAIISRYLITGTDSMLYYFTPLPIAIYVVKNKFTYSIAVFAAAVALSFLFANPIVTLMVIMPNIIVGFVLGCLERYSKLKIINYVTVFFLCFVVSLVSIACYEVINGIDYWHDIVEFLNNIAKTFGFYDEAFINSLVKIITLATILIDSCIKTVLLYVVLSIVIIRLKLIPDFTIKIKMPLKFSFVTSIIYILLFITLFIFTKLYITKLSVLYEIILISLITIILIFSFYLIYQFIIFIRFKFKNINKVAYVLIVIFSVLLLPISVIGALILNFINYNILLDCM